MLQITKQDWDKIPNDYKGCWDRRLKDNGWQPDLPEEYIGRRTMLKYEECHGTTLLTEGVHFRIVE